MPPAAAPRFVDKLSIDLPVYSEGRGDVDGWSAVSAEGLRTWSLHKVKEDPLGPTSETVAHTRTRTRTHSSGKVSGQVLRCQAFRDPIG